MSPVVRIPAALVVLLGLIRMGFYLGYAAAMLPMPLEGAPFESKFVLLAYRSQAGLSLYPSWETYPHVANFFAPVYFVAVGVLGRLAGADLRTLFLIGRGISFGSGLLSAVVLGVWAGRRYGFRAGVVAALLGVGARPMDGVSVTARPDLMADLLGLGGFVLTGGKSPPTRALGLGLLVLAVFTKQTAGVYLVAAGLALALEGRRRGSLAVLGGGVGLTLLVVAAVSLTVEPNFARSLVGEGKTPWDFPAWVRLLRRVGIMSSDLLVIPALGLFLWTRGPTRDPRPAALTTLLLAVCLGTSFKRGADVNYFLSLRSAESMAVAALWAASREAATRRGTLAAAGAFLIAAVSLAPSAWAGKGLSEAAWRGSAFFREPLGEATVAVYEAAARRAGDARARVFTDSGFIDIHQKERAVFGDPWGFRMQVETGQVRPNLLIERIESEFYDLIITTTDLMEPAYAAKEFGLPMPLVWLAREHYKPYEHGAGLFFYVRRGLEPSDPCLRRRQPLSPHTERPRTPPVTGPQRVVGG